MTRIKICALTNREDALAAANLGADALGFVFAEGSLRLADPEVIASFTRELPPYVMLVGVFRNQPAEYVRRVSAQCSLHTAQLHGKEDVSYMNSLGMPCYKALSMGTPADVDKISEYPGQTTFLLDSGSGGTGIAFDWELALLAKRQTRIILAGGLNPENVSEAMIKVRPWAVDVAGGTEASKGIKDLNKMKEFIEAVRKTDAAVERER